MIPPNTKLPTLFPMLIIEYLKVWKKIRRKRNKKRYKKWFWRTLHSERSAIANYF